MERIVRAGTGLLVLLLCACACSPARGGGATPASPAATAGAPLRYLALGDSSTIGTGSGEQASFPARLRVRFTGRREVVLRNLAVNGYTSQDLIEEELPQVGRFAPDLVTLAIGANDL